MKTLSWSIATTALAVTVTASPLLLAEDKPAGPPVAKSTSTPALIAAKAGPSNSPTGLSPELAKEIQREAAAHTEYLHRTNLCRVGEDAPTFTCRTMAGEEFSFRKQRGQAVVLVTFIHAWSKEDAADARRIEKELRAKVGDRKNFQLLTIASDEEAPPLEKFIREYGTSRFLVADPEMKMFYEFATAFIHRSYVIGKDGKVKLAVGGSVTLVKRENQKEYDGKPIRKDTGYSAATFQEISRAVERELGARSTGSGLAAGPG